MIGGRELRRRPPSLRQVRHQFKSALQPLKLSRDLLLDPTKTLGLERISVRPVRMIELRELDEPPARDLQ